MTDLPQNLGAVVEADWFSMRRRFVRVGPERWATWRDDHQYPTTDVTNERCLENVVVLSQGWVEPTPEPMGFGAQVEDAEGLVLSRRSPGLYPPWVGQNNWCYVWEALPQPVKVLYEGVE